MSLLSQGIEQLQQGNPQAAIATAKKLVQLGISRSTALDLWGAAAVELGDWGVAEQKFRLALAGKPTVADSWANLGLLGLRSRNFKLAIEGYRQACKLDPHQPPYALNLANALRQRGEIEAAAEVYQMALRQHPENC